VERILVGHTSFVGPVAWISANDELPKGGIASGGMDTLVIIWDAESGNKVYTLRGHELQVTSIAVDEQGDILSASVDKYISVIYFSYLEFEVFRLNILSYTYFIQYLSV
jgi:WD40 repeat protein